MSDNTQSQPDIKCTALPSRIMTKMIIVAALIIIAIGAVYYRSFAVIPFALGVIITLSLNIIKIRMLEKTVQKVLEMDDPEAGKNVVRFQYLIRYFLTGIVLVAVGLLQNYTTPPPIYSSRETYLAVWAVLFPNGPESLLNAPLISIWGALAGIFTLQISVILIRFLKLEKDGTNFIKYEDEADVETDGKICNRICNEGSSGESSDTEVSDDIHASNDVTVGENDITTDKIS